jgi:hypothetical protein
MTLTEAVVVHELIAHSEFADELAVIDLPAPQAQKVMSDVQQALAPFIPTLGTDAYGSTVENAYREIDPGPFAHG